MTEWAIGITQFPTDEWYITRHTDQECDRCGAKGGYWCFEIVIDSYGRQVPYPVQSHIVQRPGQKGEIPIEARALSSGALKSFGSV